MAAKTKIQRRREALGLSPTEVFWRTGLNQKTLRRYELRASDPTLRSLVLLAYGLECETLAELIEDEWLDFRPREIGGKPLDADLVSDRPRLRVC